MGREIPFLFIFIVAILAVVAPLNTLAIAVVETFIPLPTGSGPQEPHMNERRPHAWPDGFRRLCHRAAKWQRLCKMWYAMVRLT